MQCKKCGNDTCHIITDTKSSGTDYSAPKGCCGYFAFGPIGLLCGACTKGKQYHTKNYWVCGRCGAKFRA